MVLLTHESWTWAKQNHREVICMKLDLAKAYDAMAWEFMFQAMITIGIHLLSKRKYGSQNVLNFNGELARVPIGVVPFF